MEQLDDNALNIYTDGSSLQGPRRGGLGYRFVTVGDDGEEVVQDSCNPGYREGTNQEMELKACVEALSKATGRHSPFDLTRFSKVVVYTDSQYVTDNLNNARSTWPHAGWSTADGTPVRNAELWKELARLTTQRYGIRVDFFWIKGKTSRHAKPSTGWRRTQPADISKRLCVLAASAARTRRTRFSGAASGWTASARRST